MLLRLYPGLISAALRKGHAGAIMLWTLARATDPSGSGMVGESEMKAAGLAVWSSSKYRRYRRDALEMGLVFYQTTNTGRRLLRLAGLLSACQTLGVQDPGHAPVLAQPTCLRTATQFRAACFVAFHTAGRGRSASNPISRNTLKELTGVGKKTQRVYEVRNNKRRDGQVKATASFLLTGLRADELQMARDFIHPGCFLYGNEVARPLPNTYQSSCQVAAGSRLRKVRKQLKHNLVETSGAGGCGRVFYDKTDAEKLEKQARQPDRPGQPSALSVEKVAIIKEKKSYRGRNVYRTIGTPTAKTGTKSKALNPLLYE